MTEKGICPIQTVFGILGGKWKHRILLELHPGPMRYNQLAASIGTISYKVLTQQLRELEEDGLVCRKVYPEVPPRVEYALTEMGESIFVVFREMRRWVWNVTRCMSRYAATAGNAGDGKRTLPVPQMRKITL